MAKNERFEKVYSQGITNVMEIWVDKETGVNYVFHVVGGEFLSERYIKHLGKS